MKSLKWEFWIKDVIVPFIITLMTLLGAFCVYKIQNNDLRKKNYFDSDSYSSYLSKIEQETDSTDLIEGRLEEKNSIKVIPDATIFIEIEQKHSFNIYSDINGAFSFKIPLYPEEKKINSVNIKVIKAGYEVDESTTPINNETILIPLKKRKL